MLYPSLAYGDKIFHEDHIYPSSKLSKEQLDNGGNFVANLQLLESKKNIRKQYIFTLHPKELNIKEYT